MKIYGGERRSYGGAGRSSHRSVILISYASPIFPLIIDCVFHNQLRVGFHNYVVFYDCLNAFNVIQWIKVKIIFFNYYIIYLLSFHLNPTTHFLQFLSYFLKLNNPELPYFYLFSLFLSTLFFCNIKQNANQWPKLRKKYFVVLNHYFLCPNMCD